MRELRSKIIAVAAISMLCVAAVSCEGNTNPNTTETVIMTTAENQNAEPEVTAAPIPETDDNGSKLSVIGVTDANKEIVTEANGVKVTEVVVLDSNGSIATEANGNNVKPVTEKVASTTKQQQIVSIEPAQTPANAGGVTEQTQNANAPVSRSDGPTLTIPKGIEASAGETFTFKIAVSGNSGYTGLYAYLVLDNSIFEYVSADGGDTDQEDYDLSKMYSNTSCTVKNNKPSDGMTTCSFLYFDSKCEPLTGDVVYATVTLKVKEGTPAGEYTLGFDKEGDFATKCNTVDTVNGQIQAVVLTPKYIDGSVVVK